MGEILKVNNRAEENLQKVEVNSYGDCIFINANDAGIFDRFAEMLAWLDKTSDELDAKERELGEKYRDAGEERQLDAFLEVTAFKKEIFRVTVEKIDNIFGQSIVRKYFRVMYEAYEGFVPDEECILDFIDTMTPVLNVIFEDRRKRIEKKYSTNRKGGNSRKYRG